MKIYFFAQKALSLHCAVAVTAFLLYCKIDFFVRAKNCTANVAQDLTYEKPNIESYVPPFLDALASLRPILESD